MSPVAADWIMATRHSFICANAADFLPQIQRESVDLILTSPPYPMVAMWDDLFQKLDPAISLDTTDEALDAFAKMHAWLYGIWQSCWQCLKSGGHLVINIGDATRSINQNFQLYSNHSRILQDCLQIGFQNLPNIIWRKQTNAPNKFMGSGMLPPGAYVTLEHEYILILRKGPRRTFTDSASRTLRRESGYFWEERNSWFSDIWDFKGVRQDLTGKPGRDRSAAYPLELAYRLISMFSLKQDLVLDPFGGTCTTTRAAIAAERNSISIELDPQLQDSSRQSALQFRETGNAYIQSRLKRHANFVENRQQSGKKLKYFNELHDTPVMTRQECDLCLREIREIEPDQDAFSIQVEYTAAGQVRAD
ncbi:MAG: site-specific DNA-methyltransferase [Leptospiraceae bacterium]|nr:site-specific DNA-methyltransferase [Leptospiraceae bacterium]